VVLLDLHMPDLLGTEVARQIRGTEGPSQRALLVALTAAAFAADREECERAGMDAFLTKPFAPAAMHDVLERAERERVRTERETTKG
jgi:CheY-like chemotaxis protein